MAPTRIVVLGGSFAGLTAAFDLKRELGDNADVTVVDKKEQFVFIPSLIWVPMGWRDPKDITFPLAPALEGRGIHFRRDTVAAIDPDTNTVRVANGTIPYDYLVVALGPHVAYGEVPGVGPEPVGHTVSICTLEHAMEARRAWDELLRNPGPVIIGATQKAGCFGAAYEFLFNVEHGLRKAHVRDRVPVTLISSEPYPGHFGIGGLGSATELTEKFFKRLDIEGIFNVAMEKVTADGVHLSDGRFVPGKFKMIIPAFTGTEAVRNSPGLADERGFIPVNNQYRHVHYPNIFAAGVAIAVKPPEATPIPIGVPKTGYMSEVMARVASKNIVADLTDEAHVELPFSEIDAKCILDAGNMGVLMFADRVFGPRNREILIPGPWSHWAKVAFERYFLWKMRTGHTELP